jgi:predicted metal-binding membrane protein
MSSTAETRPEPVRPTGPDAVAAALARRWRLVTYAAIVVLAGIGWVFLLRAAIGHGFATLGPGMAALGPLVERLGLPVAPYGGTDVAGLLAMWAAMVLAMMLPTAAPTIAAHAAAGRHPAIVGAGYLTVWGAVAVVATLLQTGLVALGALSPHMAPAGTALSASVLIAAGIYQFTPLKRVCLVRCRNPHAAFADGRSPGAAYRIGLEEGVACLGCCWTLMAVMFAAGLMNLVAMAVLGVLMGLEKVVSGNLLTYSTGILLLVAGFGLASGPFFG